MSIAKQIPSHLLPANCYICGQGPHPETGHAFWSNAQAAKDFAYQPQCGSYNVEAAYVQEHRPY